MLPRMAKLRVAIVGAGNLGTALASSLKSAGWAIDRVIARPRAKSLQGAAILARKVGSRATSRVSGLQADVIWLCVPDSGIRALARDLSETLNWRGKIALHSSGALTSDELAPLREEGAAVASAHPLMTFVKRSQPVLVGVPFAIEGDRAAVRVVRGMVRDLGGVAFSIPKKDKAAYHTWATLASPLLTALFSTSEQVAAIAGVSRKSARQRMLPILRQTIGNYAALGAADGFSGPLLRGDVETIERHLEVLETIPVARNVYASLAQAALAYLPAKNRETLKRILDSSGR
jgi:predicted short-subunit dehydrogenase-like oxidoreductase (DUF2520 family)